MERFAKWFGTLYKYVCVVIITCMVLIVFINTMLRYCFNSGLVENEELLRYLFIWSTFLGITAVYNEHRHIAVTMFTDRLSPKVRTIFAFIVNFLVLYTLYIFIDGTLMYIEESKSTVGQMIKISYVYIIISAVFCGGACVVLTLRDMYKQLRAIIKSDFSEFEGA